MVGVLTIVLGSIGSPHTLGARNVGGENDPDDYYGNGLGYSKEPLNVVFIVIVILTWVSALLFSIALFFSGTAHIARKLVFQN